MKFDIKKCHIEIEKSDCIIVGIFESQYLSLSAKKLDKISNGYISQLLKYEKLKNKIGQTLLLYHVPKIISKRILLVSCGKEEKLNEYLFRKIIKKTINTINNTNSTKVICFLNELKIKNQNIYWNIRQIIDTIMENLYTFDQLKNHKKKSNNLLKEITFNAKNDYELTNGRYAIQHGIAITSGIKIAKDLSNLPPNICNSNYLASQAYKFSKKFNTSITTDIINEKQMKKLKMNAYLSVGSGSKNESLMSVIKYQGDPIKNNKPIILIGKGLTFDSGGISIKPSKNMDEMKFDMCGAATVYGIMHVAVKLNLPLNIIGILAGCENMPSSSAYRPGDIITTMSGKTIEILNTDAEGRLVLCDVLTYVKQFNPELVIDIATLTGACVVALGKNITGLMSNNNSLVKELILAGNITHDYVWRLPIFNKYYEQLNSNFADITNISNQQGGGAITAACFLSHFTKKYIWAHLDIAGTAWNTGKIKGATGRPVSLLSQFLLKKSGLEIK
ncbi:Cytosol aminopeptidase [Serratia symbiotica]|nr:Cytosol aminopeptidase [Serratia symbiotica]